MLTSQKRREWKIGNGGNRKHGDSAQPSPQKQQAHRLPNPDASASERLEQVNQFFSYVDFSKPIAISELRFRNPSEHADPNDGCCIQDSLYLIGIIRRELPPSLGT